MITAILERLTGRAVCSLALAMLCATAMVCMVLWTIRAEPASAVRVTPIGIGDGDSLAIWGKEEITPAKSQNTIFQKGFRMIYCNPVPIAAACLMGKDVVQDALDAIFLGIIDLTKFGKRYLLKHP